MRTLKSPFVPVRKQCGLGWLYHDQEILPKGKENRELNQPRCNLWGKKEEEEEGFGGKGGGEEKKNQNSRKHDACSSSHGDKLLHCLPHFGPLIRSPRFQQFRNDGDSADIQKRARRKRE